MTSFDNIARVYDKVNERQGHLRIDVGDVDADGEFWPQQTYRFMNHDDGKILFGAHGGPSGMLDADALRRIAEYCSNRADVIENIDHSVRALTEEPESSRVHNLRELLRQERSKRGQAEANALRLAERLDDGDIVTCSSGDCTNEVRDGGDGWDGYCPSCADKRAADGGE